MTSSDSSSDTQYPLNIDDHDLSVDMQELPVGKVGWTEMTFPLVIIEICGVFHHFVKAFEQSPISAPNVEAKRQRIMQKLSSRFEAIYLKNQDCNIPIQLATLLMSRLMIRKLAFMTQQPSFKRPKSMTDTSGATDKSLDIACEILEINLQLQSDDLLQNFHWLWKTYVQYNSLTYVLWHLCLHPTGRHVKRAWEAVERVFGITDSQDIPAKARSKWEVLHHLRRKAMQARRPEHSEAVVADDGIGPSTPSNPDLIFGDPVDWDTNTIDVPDWDNLMDDFDMSGFGN